MKELLILYIENHYFSVNSVYLQVLDVIEDVFMFIASIMDFRNWYKFFV